MSANDGGKALAWDHCAILARSNNPVLARVGHGPFCLLLVSCSFLLDDEIRSGAKLSNGQIKDVSTLKNRGSFTFCPCECLFSTLLSISFIQGSAVQTTPSGHRSLVAEPT